MSSISCPTSPVQPARVGSAYMNCEISQRTPSGVMAHWMLRVGEANTTGSAVEVGVGPVLWLAEGR